MDTFVDSVAWHDCVFIKTRSGRVWRIWLEGRAPMRTEKAR